MIIETHPPLSIHELGKRDNQEDSLAQWNNRLFVLCDGMGGHEKGEVASQTVTQSLVRWYKEFVNKDVAFTDDQLLKALEYAYIELDKQDGNSPKKMGTTLTLLYLHTHGIIAAHIGDSRIYHIRPDVGVLYQSRDHSLAFDLYQAGEISLEEMSNFAQKNIITRAMTPGKDNRVRPDIIHITDIEPDDYFYLCSDGMLEQMSNDELIAHLSSLATDKEKQKLLIKATINNQDNHSAWLIHIKNVIHEECDKQFVNEEPIARCNAINIIPKDISTKEEDDVVIISEPPVLSKKKKNNWVKWVSFIFVIILTLLIVWTLFSISNERKKQEVSESQMLIPIILRRNNDSTKKDTNQPRIYESTRNQ